MTDAVTRQRQRGRLKTDPAARALAAENPHRLRALAAALGTIPGNDGPITSLERIALAAYCGHKPSQEAWPGLVIVMGEGSGPHLGMGHTYFWCDTGDRAGEIKEGEGHPYAFWLTHLQDRWGDQVTTVVAGAFLEEAYKGMSYRDKQPLVVSEINPSEVYDRAWDAAKQAGINWALGLAA